MTNIYKGLKLKGSPAEIPDCSRRQLPTFFKEEMGYKVGVEIGVYKGDFSRWLCKDGLILYSIDPWFAYINDKAHNQERQETLYASAKAKLDLYPNCAIIRKASMDALKDFKNESIDFVYIDGNHSFEHVVADITGWSKKVRKGGTIAGHDYDVDKNPEVKFAVDAYTKANGINNWWVLGNKENKEGENRDPYRSWMFFK